MDAEHHYESLSEAITDLQSRGYTLDFNFQPDGISSPTLQLHLHPERFTIVEFYRFEGMSSTDDNCIVYAITSDKGQKGTLVDAYGMYAENLNESMIQKLRINR